MDFKRKDMAASFATAPTSSTISMSSLNEDNGAAAAINTSTIGERELEKQHSALKIRRQSQSLRTLYHHQGDSSRRNKSVGFDELEVYEFNIELGDNPAVSSGPPVTLSWEVSSVERRKVDDYEEHHPPRRTKSDLKTPKEVREQWLREQGIESTEFHTAEEEAAKIRMERKESAEEPESDLKKLIAESKKKKALEKQEKGWKRLLPVRKVAHPVRR